MTKRISCVLLTLLVLCAIEPCLAQDIEKIIIVSQEGGEPPTTPGPDQYSIEYVMNSDGDWVATHVTENRENLRMPASGKIERQRTDRTGEWEAARKVIFTLPELGIDRRSIELAAKKNIYQLNLPIPDDIVLNVDSFAFCQNYKMTKTILIGGETISVRKVSESRSAALYVFDSNDIGAGKFNLKDYIFWYAILNERIPNEFPHFNFFSKEKLAEIVVYYQQTVECEGYYYQEYADKNRLTGREKRMKVGWNFIKYMKERTKKN